MFMGNYKLSTLLYLFPLRILLDYIAMGMSLLKFDFGRINAIFKAHFFILFHLNLIRKKRRHVKTLRVKKDHEVMMNFYRGSIALSSFLFAKKKFSDI